MMGFLRTVVVVAAIFRNGGPTSPIVDAATDNIFDVSYVPQQVWASSLGQQPGEAGLGSIEQGNAVTASPDGTLIYITRNNGRLDVLDAANGQAIFSYTPHSVNSLPVACESGVTFATDLGGNTIAVYAVVYKPPAFSGVTGGEKSRIVVVTASGTIRLFYLSEPVDGVIAGTPIITQGTFPGRFVFFTRNTQTGSEDEPLLGHFTVVDIIDETVLFTEDSTKAHGVATPYGPIGVSSSPLFGGKYVGGYANLADMAVWTSSSDEGLGGTGFIRAFQFPPEFTPGFPLALNTIFLRDVRWNAVVEPTLSRDGQNLFVGIRGNGVRAWIGDRSFQDLPSWSSQLADNDADDSRPIQNPGALSTSEDIIFFTGTASSIAAMDVRDGSVLWKYNSASVLTSSPKVSPDDSRLYAITAEDGIAALKIADGNLVWTITCNDLDSSVVPCLSRVRGGFSISPDGQFLFFGDIGGNVRSVRLGDAVGGITFPTVSPVTPSESSDGDSFLGSDSNLSLYVGTAIILGVIVAFMWLSMESRGPKRRGTTGKESDTLRDETSIATDSFRGASSRKKDRESDGLMIDPSIRYSEDTQDILHFC